MWYVSMVSQIQTVKDSVHFSEKYHLSKSLKILEMTWSYQNVSSQVSFHSFAYLYNDLQCGCIKAFLHIIY